MKSPVIEAALIQMRVMGAAITNEVQTRAWVLEEGEWKEPDSDRLLLHLKAVRDELNLLEEALGL